MCGVLCVITCGEVLMLLWCVDSWDSPLKVRKRFQQNVGVVACCDSSSVAPIDAVAFSSAHFGVGTGPIHLDEVGCHGNETTLISCLHNSALSCYSGHYEDAGVRCQGKC